MGPRARGCQESGRGSGVLAPVPAADPDRILLVDDDPANLVILRQALDGHGYKLLVATSGEDALRVAQRARPSLVLLDVLMPGMDGYEACRRNSRVNPATADAAFIFLSTLEDARDKVCGLEAGAVDFVSKPSQPGLPQLSAPAPGGDRSDDLLSLQIID